MAMDWIRNPRVTRVLKIVGFVLFGLLVFLFSIGYTLPEERLKSFIESKAAQAGMILSIDELDAGGFGSMRLSGLKLELPRAGGEASEGSQADKPAVLDFDEVDIKVGLFSVLFGSPSIRVVLRDGEGTAGPLKIKASPETIEIEVEEIVDFPVPDGIPLGPLPLSGIIKSGSGRLLWDRETGLAGSEGAFEIMAENLVARKPVFATKQAGTIALSDIVMGRLEASIVIDKRSNITALKQTGRRGSSASADSRVVYFDKFKVDGKDLAATVEGSSLIRLMPGRSLAKGQMTVELAFSIDDAFFDKTEKGSDEKPNRFLKTLLEMDPKWKSAKSGRYYGLICTGTLDKPSCLPKKPSMRGGDVKAGQDGDADGETRKPVKRQPPKPRQQAPKPAPIQVNTDGEGGGSAPVPAPIPIPQPTPVEPPPTVQPVGGEPSGNVDAEGHSDGQGNPLKRNSGRPGSVDPAGGDSVISGSSGMVGGRIMRNGLPGQEEREALHDKLGRTPEVGIEPSPEPEQE